MGISKKFKQHVSANNKGKTIIMKIAIINYDAGNVKKLTICN